MIIECSAEEGMRLTRMSALLAELVRILPSISTPTDDAGSRGRIYPPAFRDEEENLEWESLVNDELRQLFAGADEIVSGDLADMEEEDGHEGFALTIPWKHTDAWLNCLNRARLVIAEKNNIEEKEMATPFDGSIESPQDLALFQIHFYGIIMENLLNG